MPAIETELEDLYRHLHSHPELSGQEHETAELIAGRLQDDGYAVSSIDGGVVGVMTAGSAAGPTVLFRADIDALPVREATGLPYASQAQTGDSPVMHACGHDMHIAAGLGAARLMAAGREHWDGTYIALFQPAEETGTGAQAMVDAGLVSEIPVPDVALAQHVMGGEVTAGQVGLRSGPVLSAAATLEVRVYGVGSHGSMPQLGIDPIVIAASIVMRLQTLVAREIAPSDFGVVTVGAINGGTLANIIPGTATLKINLRAYSQDTLDQLVAGVRRIVRAEALAAAAPVEPDIDVIQTFPLTDNDELTTQHVRAGLEAYFGPDRIIETTPATASEDFSVIPEAFGIPYAYWSLGGYPAGEQSYPNHSPHFAPVIEPTLRTGVEAVVAAATTWLGRAEA